MLIKLTALRNWKVEAEDGEIGAVVDVFFDDERWGARYVVVETGDWLASRRVLLSPASVKRPLAAIGQLHVDLTREQVANSPDVDADKPVSRHYEIAHALHYGYPPYWSGPMLWGAGIYPGVMPVSADPAQLLENERLAAAEEAAAKQSHLRSGRAVLGYRVDAKDGDAGDLDDLAVDDETWAIRHLVIDVRRWWPGGRVLVEPAAVVDVSWADRRLRLRLTREQVKQSPAGD
jgi:hypothetical protein